MMEFKQIIDNFKAKYAQAGTHLGFSLLPLLIKDLVDNGLNFSVVDGKFYQTLVSEVFSGESQEMHVDAIDALMLLGQLIPLPKVTEAPQIENKKEAIVEDDIIRTDHLVDNIPKEEDEGDPLYTAPEDIIPLRPEDFAPMEYDEEFCAKIGATKDRR